MTLGGIKFNLSSFCGHEEVNDYYKRVRVPSVKGTRVPGKRDNLLTRLWGVCVGVTCFLSPYFELDLDLCWSKSSVATGTGGGAGCMVASLLPSHCCGNSCWPCRHVARASLLLSDVHLPGVQGSGGGAQSWEEGGPRPGSKQPGCSSTALWPAPGPAPPGVLLWRVWRSCPTLLLSGQAPSPLLDPFQNKNLDWFPRMRAMSLVSNEGEGEQNEIRILQEKLNCTMKLVSHLTAQLNELKEQVCDPPAPRPAPPHPTDPPAPRPTPQIPLCRYLCLAPRTWVGIFPIP